MLSSVYGWCIFNFSSFDILLNISTFSDSLHSKGSRIHGWQTSLGEFCGVGIEATKMEIIYSLSEILWQQMVSNGHGKIRIFMMRKKAVWKTLHWLLMVTNLYCFYFIPKNGIYSILFHCKGSVYLKMFKLV